MFVDSDDDLVEGMTPETNVDNAMLAAPTSSAVVLAVETNLIDDLLLADKEQPETTPPNAP